MNVGRERKIGSIRSVIKALFPSEGKGHDDDDDDEVSNYTNFRWIITVCFLPSEQRNFNSVITKTVIYTTTFYLSK